MDAFLETLEQLNVVSTVLRLGLALVLGGILGMERGRKGRPAGLKTYMIVCMASALVMITGEYVIQKYGVGDPTRLGAQVISGIGFLGAGTIIITSRQVKGLTTAAALWAAACMGLAVGAGFYVGAIICGVFVLLAMSAMSRLDNRLRRHSREITFFTEFDTMQALGDFMDVIRKEGHQMHDIKITRGSDAGAGFVGATLSVDLRTATDHVELISLLSQMEGIRHLEELDSV